MGCGDRIQTTASLMEVAIAAGLNPRAIREILEATATAESEDVAEAAIRAIITRELEAANEAKSQTERKA